MRTSRVLSFFFFNDTATTEIYTLSLHDALPISRLGRPPLRADVRLVRGHRSRAGGRDEEPSRVQPQLPGPERGEGRSEEHTSELQSRSDLVCRLLLEKKKQK